MAITEVKRRPGRPTKAETEERERRAEELAIAGASAATIAKETGISDHRSRAIRARHLQEPQEPIKLSDSRGGGQTAGASSSGALADAERRIGNSWQRMWAVLADVWEEPELEISDREKAEFAKPAAESLEMVGHLDKTRYLAPVEVIGVAFSQAAPRIRKIMDRPMPRKGKPAQGTAPTFKRPAGMAAGPVVPIAPEPQPPAGMNIDAHKEVVDVNSPLSRPVT